MMKKLLILMLVLGLVSTASAALTALAPVVTGHISWNIQGPAGSEQLVGYNLTGLASGPVNGGGYGIDLGNSGAGVFVQAIGPIIPVGNYTGSLPLLVPPTTPPAGPPNYDAGGLGKVYVGAGWPGWDAFDGAAPGYPTVAASNWYVFNLVGAVNGDHIDLYDYNTGFLPVGVMNIIPEPVTIMLLGLGSLLLRRRK
jgi:hypothetical protein